MIVGDPHTFAIESEITAVFPDRDNAALGFFVIHVGGKCFGVKEADATMLGNSYGEVEQRLHRRGTHEMPFLEWVEAVDIAKAYLHALWRDAPVVDCLGVTKQEFVDGIHSNNVIWAPDGDEAFDDGSHVLQFDIDGKVRLIAFVNELADLDETIREEWVDARAFYGTLSTWKERFSMELEYRLEKISDT